MNVNTNKEAVEEFLTRGVENIFPNKEFLREQMLKGERLTMYLGIDPTANTLHLGSTIPIIKLGDWQKLGHRAILLIGDFTAMIGDPTDKTASRKKLTREEVLTNAKDYQKQASAVLSFDGDNKAEWLFNSVWLDKLSFADVLEVASQLTHAQMIKRDMFQKRIEEGRDLYMHELLYPLMQGYDSVAMDVDGEVGGNDQTFNMLVGRDLLKKMKSKEKFVISLKLLADSNGKKMGKTEGNMAALSDSPFDMFSKVMTWGDDFIASAFELCTRMPMEKIEEVKQELARGAHPRDVKMKLAHEIVLMYHGDALATQAQNEFVNVFQKGELPEEMLEFSVSKGTQLGDVLVPAVLASKGEFKRLIDGGALYFNDEKITSYNFVVTTSGIARWSRHFAKVSVE